MKSVPNSAIKGGVLIQHANRTDSVRKNAPSGKVGAAEKFKRLKCFGPRNVKQVRFINLSEMLLVAPAFYVDCVFADAFSAQETKHG